MKITIRGVPRFTLNIDLETVIALTTLSQHHYDFACKKAGVQGGFLSRWLLLLQWQEQDGVAEEGRSYPEASFTELDITLKICEMRFAYFAGQPDGAKIKKLNEYCAAVHKALQRANELYHLWKEE